MTQDNQSAEPVVHEANVSGPGALLRARREALEIDIDTVAHELHLDASVVTLLESDKTEALGAAVFVKGYLRSYARFLGLSEDQMIAAYQPSESDPEEFRTVSARREIKMGARLSTFLLWSLFALVALIVSVYLLTGSDEAEVALPQTKKLAEVDVPAKGLADAFVIVEEVPEVLELSPVPADTAETSPAPAVAIAEADAVQITVQASGPQPLSLTIQFAAECWVEVSDARRRLLYGLEKAGSSRSFEVWPPLRFFIGNIDAVSLELAGDEYRIPASVRTGRNTARFTLSRDDIETGS